MKSNFKNAQTRTGDMEPETISKNGARAKKMKKKNLIILSLFFLTGTSMSATYCINYVCYYADTTESNTTIGIPYLRSVAYSDCIGFEYGPEYAIIAKLVNHNPVFTCEKTESEKRKHIKVFLKTAALTETECQEIIASFLMNGYEKITIALADGTERTYAIEDVWMPFFHYGSVFDDEDIIHTVEAGETIYGISKLYGIAAEDLMETNGLEDELLQIGQELTIPLNSDIEGEIEGDDNQTDNSNGGWSNVLYMLFGASILLNAILFWGLKRRNI